MRLSDKVALVTGASTGIGRAIAIALAEEGAHVAINYRHDEAGARQTAEAVEALGRRAMLVKADVTHAGEVEGMIELVTGAWHGLDVLVNNAGVVNRGPLLDLTEAMWDEVVDVNLKGVFLCTQSAARWMKPRQTGAIVNISSMRGVEGGSSSAHYTAAKAGVIALTKTVARELAPHIRVNAVAPGYVETRIQSMLTDAQRETINAGTPLGRFGQPSEIARVVAFLASEDASYMTGQTLVVDGGRVMV
ncbi:3-oxoacyl-[acyl-carrier-protein] reductase FabG [compost metagenome]